MGAKTIERCKGQGSHTDRPTPSAPTCFAICTDADGNRYTHGLPQNNDRPNECRKQCVASTVHAQSTDEDEKRCVCVCVYRPERRDVHTDASSSSTPFIVCEHAEEESCAYLCVCVLPSTNGRLLLQGHTGNSAIVATTTNTVNFSIKLFVFIYKNVSSTTAPFKYLWQ